MLAPLRHAPVSHLCAISSPKTDAWAPRAVRGRMPRREAVKMSERCAGSAYGQSLAGMPRWYRSKGLLCNPARRGHWPEGGGYTA